MDVARQWCDTVDFRCEVMEDGAFETLVPSSFSNGRLLSVKAKLCKKYLMDLEYAKDFSEDRIF